MMVAPPLFTARFCLCWAGDTNDIMIADIMHCCTPSGDFSALSHCCCCCCCWSLNSSWCQIQRSLASLSRHPYITLPPNQISRLKLGLCRGVIFNRPRSIRILPLQTPRSHYIFVFCFFFPPLNVTHSSSSFSATSFQPFALDTGARVPAE